MNRRFLLIGLLVVTIVAIGGLLLWWPSDRPGTKAATGAKAGPATTNSVASTTNAVAAAKAALAAGPARSGIDLAYVRSRWDQWLNAPARDPFLVVRAATPRPAAVETPVSRFQLVATWLQTGGRMAVIDRVVYAEGDQLAEYRIVRINAEEVVVQGPTQTDKITFHSYVPAARQAQAKNSTNLINRLLGPEKEKLF